jgi:hypothetical protein
LPSWPNSLPATGGYTNNIALSHRIDQLSGTELSNITVSGVSGLTAADIPTDITASNYLPLAGGALTLEHQPHPLRQSDGEGGADALRRDHGSLSHGDKLNGIAL